MKKVEFEVKEDELRPECDLSQLKGRARGEIPTLSAGEWFKHNMGPTK